MLSFVIYLTLPFPVVNPLSTTVPLSGPLSTIAPPWPALGLALALALIPTLYPFALSLRRIGIGREVGEGEGGEGVKGTVKQINKFKT